MPAERHSNEPAHLAQIIGASSPHSTVTAYEDRVVFSQCGEYEPRPGFSAEIDGPDSQRGVFRYKIDTGHAERGKLVPSKKPCSAMDVERDAMACHARGVYRYDFDVVQGAQDVRLEEIWVAVCVQTKNEM